MRDRVDTMTLIQWCGDLTIVAPRFPYCHFRSTRPMTDRIQSDGNAIRAFFLDRRFIVDTDTLNAWHEERSRAMDELHKDATALGKQRLHIAQMENQPMPCACCLLPLQPFIALKTAKHLTDAKEGAVCPACGCEVTLVVPLMGSAYWRLELTTEDRAAIAERHIAARASMSRDSDTGGADDAHEHG